MTDLKNSNTWQRLEDQLKWYDTKSVSCQRKYKVMKCLQIVLSISIPILVHVPYSVMVWIVSVAGGLIAALEVFQQLGQYPTLWITYRSIAECLKHEKYLFLAGAGAYHELDSNNCLVSLAERIEEIVSPTHAKWNKRGG